MKVQKGFVTVIDFQGVPEKLWIAENQETPARILADYYALILGGRVMAFREGEKDTVVIEPCRVFGR